MLAKLSAVLGLIVLVQTPALGDDAAVEKARLARTLWSAFQCSTYAEMFGDTNEQSRLFDVGMKAGRAFLDAVNNKQIPPEVANREVPFGVITLLQGPTSDFILGRVFENAMRDAFDRIVKQDDHGFALEPSKWLNNKILRQSMAKTKYLSANCVLVK